MDSPLVMRVLASCVDLANKASSIIRTIYLSKDLAVIDKGHNDPQSRADRDSQRCIVQSLLKTFPNLRVIGEEGQLDSGDVPIFHDFCPEVLRHPCPTQYASISIDDLVVWVDPLDGTKEFTEGLVDHVTILIGLALNGKPVGGVMTQPFYDPVGQSNYTTRTVWALVGLGVFGLNVTKIPGNLPYPIDESVCKQSVPHVILVSRSHPSANQTSVLESFAPTQVLRYGGCGFKALRLLEGAGHVFIYPNPGTKRWDTCAPEAILISAGGSLTDMFGKAYDYHASASHSNDRGVLATMSADWISGYVKHVPKQVLDTLSK